MDHECDFFPIRVDHKNDVSVTQTQTESIMVQSDEFRFRAKPLRSLGRELCLSEVLEPFCSPLQGVHLPGSSDFCFRGLFRLARFLVRVDARRFFLVKK